MASHKILVVDDDPHIREVICFALEKAGYVSCVAGDGLAALEAVGTERPSLIVLDIGLPEMDGLEVCRSLRKTSEVPVLFLSARDDEIDRIVGLELGADDYVVKPFSPRELVARVGVVLKRYGARGYTGIAVDEASDVLEQGGLSLSSKQRIAKFEDKTVNLTALEFNLLAAFMRRPKQVFTRELILEAAYPDNMHVSDRTIDSHVRNIRAKFVKAGCSQVIETVHGVGFRLGACEDVCGLNDV